VNAIVSPVLPFIPLITSIEITLSMKRRSAVHCDRTSATRPYTTADDSPTSCSKLSGATVVAKPGTVDTRAIKTVETRRRIG
jgi:hypothetical protein